MKVLLAFFGLFAAELLLVAGTESTTHLVGLVLGLVALGVLVDFAFSSGVTVLYSLAGGALLLLRGNEIAAWAANDEVQPAVMTAAVTLTVTLLLMSIRVPAPRRPHPPYCY